MATGTSKLRHLNSGELVVLGQGQVTPDRKYPRPSSTSSSVKVSSRPASRQSSSGGLEFLPNEEFGREVRPGSAASSCQNSRQSSASGRSQTPSKQVSLPTVKRKEDRDDVHYGDFNWKEHEELAEKNLSNNSGDVSDVTEKIQHLAMSGECRIFNGADENDMDEESSSDEEESEEEVISAPNELLMEFVSCMMEEDFPNALKLCKMILIYEPDNAQAKEFLPVIEEKIKMDQEAAAESSGSGTEASDDNEYDDDEDDDDDSESDSDDDDEDDDDSEESDDDNIPDNSDVEKYVEYGEMIPEK